MTELSARQKQIIEQEKQLGKDLLAGRYMGDLDCDATPATTPNPFLPERKITPRKETSSGTYTPATSR